MISCVRVKLSMALCAFFVIAIDCFIRIAHTQVLKLVRAGHYGT